MYVIVGTGPLHVPGLPASPGGPCGPAKAMYLELELTPVYSAKSLLINTDCKLWASAF